MAVSHVDVVEKGAVNGFCTHGRVRSNRTWYWLTVVGGRVVSMTLMFLACS